MATNCYWLSPHHQFSAVQSCEWQGEKDRERESEEERDKKSARHEMKSFLARFSSQSSLVLVFARECRRNRVRYIRINIDDMFHHSHSHI